MARNRVTVKIEGGRELLEKLKQLGVDVDEAARQAGYAGAQVVADAANRVLPEADVQTEVADESRKGTITVNIGFTPEKWYLRFIELGAAPHPISGSPLVFEGNAGTVVTWAVQHPGMAKRPFLRPALDENEQRATDAVGDELRKAIEAVS